MKYLIDTHVFIWSLVDSKRLPQQVKDILRNPRNKCFLSIVSIWEIATKVKIGKLSLDNFSLQDSKKYCKKLSLSILPVSFKDIMSYFNLPLFKNHRDPFDRMLIATAIERKFTLLSRDTKLPQYAEAGLLHLW